MKKRYFFYEGEDPRTYEPNEANSATLEAIARGLIKDKLEEAAFAYDGCREQADIEAAIDIAKEAIKAHEHLEALLDAVGRIA